MKIVAEMGERITIVVPSRLGPGVSVMLVDDRGSHIAEVTTEDGLIGKIAECVIRRDGTDNTGRK